MANLFLLFIWISSSFFVCLFVMIAYIDMDVQLLLPLLELLPAKREALAAEIQDLRNRIQIRRQSQSQPGLAF
jgi:hypothetical protein